MQNTKREYFIISIADLLKIDISNIITKEFLEAQTGWIKDEWYIDFIEHIGNTKAEYKKPLEVITLAVKNYKTIKYNHLYSSINEKTKELLQKLDATFRAFDNSGQTPHEKLTCQHFSDTNRDTGKKTPTFSKNMLKILEFAGTWHYLYGRKHDVYGLTKLIEGAYNKNIEKIIKDTAVTLGNAPQLDYQANKLIELVGGEPTEVKQYQPINSKVSSMLKKGAMAHDIGMSKRAGA